MPIAFKKQGKPNNTYSWRCYYDNFAMLNFPTKNSSPMDQQLQAHIPRETLSAKMPFRSLMEPLLVIFNKAVQDAFNNRKYYISYSIPGGVYGYFQDYMLHHTDEKIISNQIKKLISENLSFGQEVLPKEKVQRYFENSGRVDVLKLLYSNHMDCKSNDSMYLARLNGNAELFFNHINENYFRLEKFKFFRFNKGFFLIADPDFYDRVMPKRLEISKYLKRFDESEETMKLLGIENFSQLNEVIKNGELSEFIKISEAYQAKKIGRIADNIVSHPLKPRLIFLAGPTSSGKTTSANRLAIELKVLGKKVLMISLDNYYLPHSQIPFDSATGLQNFELITALDLQLFRNTIHRLINGEVVHLPKYRFDGLGSVPDINATRITDDTYIIVEGIHGLNPDLWKNALDIESYRLYVSALNTLNIHDHLPLSTSDHRLIRRLVRDHLFRGYSVSDTIKRWPDVMENEYHSIFPFQESAHTIFNSSLIYEIAVFAHYAPGILDPAKAENEEVKEQILRLNRILGLLKPIDPKEIPPTSILREFIGGSSFEY
jgi:uridine kinase